MSVWYEMFENIDLNAQVCTGPEHGDDNDDNDVKNEYDNTENREYDYMGSSTFFRQMSPNTGPISENQHS